MFIKVTTPRGEILSVNFKNVLYFYEYKGGTRLVFIDESTIQIDEKAEVLEKTLYNVYSFSEVRN